MLDLLLAAEQNGLIDDAGIKEEVATFVFGVNYFFFNSTYSNDFFSEREQFNFSFFPGK